MNKNRAHYTFLSLIALQYKSNTDKEKRNLLLENYFVFFFSVQLKSNICIRNERKWQEMFYARTSKSCWVNMDKLQRNMYLIFYAPYMWYIFLLLQRNLRDLCQSTKHHADVCVLCLSEWPSKPRTAAWSNHTRSHDANRYTNSQEKQLLLFEHFDFWCCFSRSRNKYI